MSGIPEEIRRLPFRERAAAIRAWYADHPMSPDQLEAFNRGLQSGAEAARAAGQKLVTQVDAAFESARLISFDEVLRRSGITREELDDETDGDGDENFIVQSILDGDVLDERIQKLCKREDEDEGERE